MRGLSLARSLVWACSVMAVSAGAAVNLTTQGPFEVPLAETRLCVVAVHSPHNNVELRLVRPHDEKSVTVSLAMAKYDNESQISAAGLGDNVAIVSRDHLNLTAQLISLFLKDNVLAVYRAGQLKPILVYKNTNPKDIDFANFTTLYMSGPRDGYTVQLYDLDKRGYGTALAEPHGHAVRNELNEIRNVIITRLSFLEVIFKNDLLNFMSQQDLKDLNELVEARVLRPLYLLDYYGLKLEAKYEKLRQALVTTAMPKVRQKLGLQ